MNHFDEERRIEKLGAWGVAAIMLAAFAAYLLAKLPFEPREPKPAISFTVSTTTDAGGAVIYSVACPDNENKILPTREQVLAGECPKVP